MKKIFLVILLISSVASFAQDVNVMLKEAFNLERTLKEEEALEKYKQVLVADANNLKAFVKCAELSSAIGGRQLDKKVKRTFYDASQSYANKALALDSNSADANYVISVALDKLSEVETENKKVVANIKGAKAYADKALAINPDHARANYALGKWHFEMLSMSLVKKAMKIFVGDMPKATIGDAIKYMEKCKSLDQYFAANYLELAKAYKFDNKPAQAIEVLNKLVKLPNRTADDANIKAEGKKLLGEMQ